MLDYKTVDGKCGILFDSEDLTFERFEDGSDHAEWERLRAALAHDMRIGDRYFNIGRTFAAHLFCVKRLEVTQCYSQNTCSVCWERII